MTTADAPTGRPVAIVTGGARNLGRAVARHLALEGFDIAVTGRSDEASVDAGLTREFANCGARFRYFQHDTADCDAHAALIAAVAAWGGRLDCLVNNVGLVARQRVDLLDLVPDQLDAMIDVNLRGTFFLAQQFAKALLDQPADGYRAIINVSSIAAEILNNGLGHYCMSKAALSTATKALALRLAPHDIAVHEVRPGFVWRDTDAAAATTPLNAWIKGGGIPAKRAGAPDDVGKAIAALAAGRIPYMTGQPIWLAGGINLPTAF